MIKGELSKTRITAILVYLAVFLCAGTTLWLTNSFQREELQQINKQFAFRNLLLWQPESLLRLNPKTLWTYHQDHEQPNLPWCWDYTLSWLLENNHPKKQLNIVIFNHLSEDEPPQEAVADHPWMKPLTQHPVARRTMAAMVRVLAAAGARTIVLDYEYPQQNADDKELAAAIHDCETGTAAAGRKIPVFAVQGVYRRSSENLSMAQTTSLPIGLISELQKLQPGASESDIAANHTGTSGLYQDEDQVVRRYVVRMQSLEDGDSLVLKALKASGHQVSDNVPDIIDINFLAPPNSNIFPIRCQSYLLDPARKAALLKPPPGYMDVSVKDAIVIVGDGMQDTFNSSTSNSGVAPMSGPEMVGHAMDTVSAQRWLQRPSPWQALGWELVAALTSVLAVAASRVFKRKNLVAVTRAEQIKRLTADVALLLTMIAAWIAFTGIMFSLKTS